MAFHDSRFVSGWIVGVPMPGAQQNATGQGQIKAGRIKFLYALFFHSFLSLSISISIIIYIALPGAWNSYMIDSSVR